MLGSQGARFEQLRMERQGTQACEVPKSGLYLALWIHLLSIPGAPLSRGFSWVQVSN